MNVTDLTGTQVIVAVVAGLVLLGGFAWAIVGAIKGRAEALKSEAPQSVTSDSDENPPSQRSSFASRLSGFFSTTKPDDVAWAELEEALLTADVGAATSQDLIIQVKRGVIQGDMSPKEALREALVAALNPEAERGLDLPAPGVGPLSPILMVGVNGVGKTTSAGKIAFQLAEQGYSVVLGAADTFRAAAADQLETWAVRVGATIIRAEREGADPASVAHEATNAAADSGADVVLIDTAGRLQNKAGLMDQLGKIHRVVSKVAAPREILLVLDATTGQNGLAQAKVFGEVVPLTGIVLTKMDGTAKGGIVLAVQRVLGVPVKLVGMGEGAEDLIPFSVEAFVDSLLDG